MKKTAMYYFFVMIFCAVLMFFPRSTYAATELDLSYQIEDGAEIVVPKGEYELSSLYIRNVENVSIDFTGSTLICDTPIRVADSKKIVIKGGTFKPSKSMTGMGVTLNSGSLTIKKASFSEFDQAVRVYGGTLNLNDCKIKKILHVGIVVYNSGTKVNVTGGVIEKCGRRSDKTESAPDAHAAGIGIYTDSVVVLKNVTVKNNRGSGIVLDNRNGKGKSKVKIYGCTISGNGDHGVAANPKGDVFIDYYKKNGKKQYTVVKENKNDGVMLMNGSSSLKIAYLKSTKNGRDGLAVSYKSKATLIENCVLDSNKRSGLMIYDNGAVKTVNKCECSKNKQYGISLSIKGKISKLSNTKIQKNKQYGLVALSSSRVKKVSKCKINGNSVINKYADNSSKINK